MSGWSMAKLGAQVEILNHKRIPLSRIERAKRQGPYRYYGAQGVIDHIDDFLFDGEFVLVAEDGENLRSRKQPIGSLVSGRFWVNNHAHILRARDGVANNRFLLHAINNAALGGFITGAAQPKLTKANLERIEFPCPPAALQARIAALLARFDELIEINERRIDVLEQLVKLLFHEWFVRFRFPKHTASDVEAAATPAGPKGWTACRIGDIAHMARHSVTPMSRRGDVFEHFSIPAFDADRLPLFESGESIRSSKFLLRDEAVLLSKLNPRIPRVWFVSPESDSAIASSEFLPWEGTSVSNAWLWAMFSAASFRAWLVGTAGGTSTSHQRVKPDDISNRSVWTGDSGVHRAFDSIGEPCLREAATLRAQNRQLATTRDLLLPRLVTGRLDISDIDLGDLLEREAA